MYRLNQKINYWNKPIQYEEHIKQKHFKVFFKFFCYRTASSISYAFQSEEEARVDGINNEF